VLHPHHAIPLPNLGLLTPTLHHPTSPSHSCNETAPLILILYVFMQLCYLDPSAPCLVLSFFPYRFVEHWFLTAQHSHPVLGGGERPPSCTIFFHDVDVCSLLPCTFICRSASSFFLSLPSLFHNPLEFAPSISLDLLSTRLPLFPPYHPPDFILCLLSIASHMPCSGPHPVTLYSTSGLISPDILINLT